MGSVHLFLSYSFFDRPLRAPQKESAIKEEETCRFYGILLFSRSRFLTDDCLGQREKDEFGRGKAGWRSIGKEETQKSGLKSL
jgi:hypothetical protein